MRLKSLWVLLSVVAVTAICFAPESSLLQVKRALEIAVIMHLVLEVIKMIQQD
jgi:hypothetical protein